MTKYGVVDPRETNTEDSITVIGTMAEVDVRVTVEELEEAIGISLGTIHNFLHQKLNLR